MGRVTRRIVDRRVAARVLSRMPTDLETSPLAFWRARRAKSLVAPARQSGLSAAAVAALEAGRATAGTAVFGRLAQVLGIEVEDIALC